MSVTADASINNDTIKSSAATQVVNSNTSNISDNNGTQEIYTPGFMDKKAEGNLLVKSGQYKQAVNKYTEALGMCDSKCKFKEVGLVYSNRALCNLQLNMYQNCIDDANSSLQIIPDNIKALYRRANAQNRLGNDSASLNDIRTILKIEPKNPEALKFAENLAKESQKRSNEVQTTTGIVDKILSELEFGNSDRVEAAAKNLAIVSRENSSGKILISTGKLPHLAEIMETTSLPVRHHMLQAFVGLCQNSPQCVQAVMEQVCVERIQKQLLMEDIKVSESAATIFYKSLETLFLHKTQQQFLELAQKLLKSIIEWLSTPKLVATSRDILLESIMRTASHNELIYFFMKNDVIKLLLDVCSLTLSNDTNHTDKTRHCISTTLHTFYKTLGYDKKRKSTIQDTCFCYVMHRMNEDDSTRCLAGLTVLSTITEGVPAIGNEILNNEKVLTIALKLASSSDERAQLVAVENLALASSDKSSFQPIINQAAPIVKKLYTSKNGDVRVRAMVCICKLISLSKNDDVIELQGDNLMKACRGFVVKSTHDQTIKRWAVEGLTFLSINAIIKESICEDIPFLAAILDIANCYSDKALHYGLAALLVNLTNSYDKPEKNPELEELAKFSGEHVPTPHEWDSEEHVTKRVQVLISSNVIVALNTLSSSESNTCKEQLARVFLALAEEVKNRGKVVQQGGARSLIILANNNSDIGKQKAAQALAKIAITTNPELAYPGERVLEVISPLVKLLKSENQLQQFESLMALTNLASIGDSVRKKIFTEKGVSWIESLQFEEHEMLRRAGTECMCNLIQCEDIRQLYRADGNDRVKVMTLFSGEDDPLLRKAASGALAMLTSDAEVEICKKVLDVKPCMEIFEELLGSGDDDLQYRGICVLTNIVLAQRELAERVVKYERGLEMFEVCVRKEFSERVREVAQIGIDKLCEYKLIQTTKHINSSKAVL